MRPGPPAQRREEYIFSDRAVIASKIDCTKRPLVFALDGQTSELLTYINARLSHACILDIGPKRAPSTSWGWTE